MDVKGIISRVASDVVVEQFSVPMMGKLNCAQDGGSYAILEVPEEFVESVYQAIYEPGMEKPPNYAPHISVMSDDELEKVGKIEEDG